MISPELLNVITVLASTYWRYPDALSDVLPLFTETVLFTHRELIANLLNMEPDWPCHEPSQQRQRAGLNSSPE